MTDLKSQTFQQDVMQAFFEAYQGFTAKPDQMLAVEGLSRVHQRILFFVARHPGLSVSDLLSCLKVSKQALNTPLRQLLELGLVISEPANDDKRKRLLELTEAGIAFEARLRVEQVNLLERCLEHAGEAAFEGWLAFNRALAAERAKT